MKIQLLLCFAATISCCSSQADYQPHIDDVSLNNLVPTADCEPGAFSCSDDCLEVIFCSGNGPVTVDTCFSTAGTVCSTSTHQCVTGTECEHPPTHGPITCNALGYFPDPVFCEDYHLCSTIGSESLWQNCTSPSAYNPLTTLCSLTQTDRVCVEGPIPTCQAPGDVGPQQENPNIYYVCVKSNGTLYPELYKCPSNEIFVDNQCQLSSTVTTTDSGSSTATSGSTATVSTSTTSSSSSSSTTSPSTSSTTSVPTTTPFPCPGVGQYPDPLDCYSYYLCFEDLQGVHFRCQNGYYFHSSERGCVKGTCVN